MGSDKKFKRKIILKSMKKKVEKYNKGAITALVLAFAFVFLILISSILGFVSLQLRYSSKLKAWNDALYIAEAGINYYQWCLNNEVEDSCSLSKNFYDAEGKLIGTFSLEVIPTTKCGQTIQTRIVSTGRSQKYPEIQRKVSVLYARKSVAKYAYLLNDNVWAGADRIIRGPYHSNGGIRMDGQNRSTVTSSAPGGEWVCTASFGCALCPTSHGCRVESGKCICPGVFTTTGNSNPDLFEFPIPSFDFEGITVDLAQMKNLAGIYLPPSTDIDVHGKGYHIKLKENGTFEVWIITRLSSSWAYSLEEGWHWDRFIIANEYLYNTYSIDFSCPVVFVEDNLWIEGKVKNKITIASADLINPNEDTSIVLPGNIEYTTQDGSDGLALIAEKNILISPVSPNDMKLSGIFIAQKGRFGRNLYWGNIKNSLEITGSIISNGRVGTKWSSGSIIVSGYLTRRNYIDSKLIYSPPPFVPYVEHNFKILDWQELEE